MLLTSEVEALVGTEVVYHAPEEIGRGSIRYFAEAMGDDNPIYRDESAARAAGFEDVVAPPTFVCETNQYAHLEADENGYAGHTWDIDIPGTYLVRGGHQYEFHRPVYPSDRLTVTWRLTGAEEKTGSSGAPMVVLTSEARYMNQNGDLLATNRETLIYRKTS